MKLLQKIIKKNKQDNLIQHGDKIVVGFSGGPDSVFMTEMLLKLRELIDFDIVLVHINHMLRGEDANTDEEFSQKYGKRHNLQVFSRRFEVEKIAKEKKITLEEAGREVRYDFYNEVLEATGSNKIALAHNKDDQLETFLFRLIRGSGLKGLAGIATKRENYIRPISEIYKSEIVGYLDENGIEYRIDKTNLENEFTRNSIRLDLIPFIEERYNPKFKDKLFSLIEEIRDINDELDTQVESVIQNDTLDIDKVLGFNRHMRGRIIAEFLYRHNQTGSRKNIFAIESLFEKGGSASIDLKNGYVCIKEYNLLKIRKNDSVEELESKELLIPGSVDFGEYIIEATYEEPKDKNKNCFYTNLEAKSVVVRVRKDGDRITPCGMKGSKKLKDIFINEKVPKEEREKIPLITYEDEIIWIAGIRGNEKFKSTTKDRCIKFIVRRAERGR